MTPGGVVMENTDVSPIIDEATIMTSGSFIADVEETVRAFKLLAESINFTSEDMSEALLQVFEMTRAVNKAAVLVNSKLGEYFFLQCLSNNQGYTSISPYLTKLKEIEIPLKTNGLDIHSVIIKCYRFNDDGVSCYSEDIFGDIFSSYPQCTAILKKNFNDLITTSKTTIDITQPKYADPNDYIERQYKRIACVIGRATKEILVRLYDCQSICYEQKDCSKILKECYTACINYISAIILLIYERGVCVYNSMRATESLNTLALHADSIINAALTSADNS